MKRTIILSLIISFLNFSNIDIAQASWLFSSHSNNKNINENKYLAQQAEIFSKKDNNLRTKVVELALHAYNTARQQGVKIKKPVITIIDYSLDSNIKRLWVLDLQQQRILFNSLVAHGKYSGGIHTDRFSDKTGSLQSSLGVFITKETYFGHDGYTLRIAGLENGFNSHAEERHIVIHGAWYASEQILKLTGQIGRSWGCPAVEPKMAAPIINTIKNGSLVFSYYPDKSWLNHSRFLM